MPSASPKKRTQTPKKFAAIEPQENSEFIEEELKGLKSSYLFYSMKTCPELKKANPDIPQNQIVKNVGLQWKALTEEQRSPFIAMAESDKARYQKELKEVETQGYFINSKGEKCKPSPKKVNKRVIEHLQQKTPEKDLPVFKYKLKSSLSLNDFRATYPDLQVERATSS